MYTVTKDLLCATLGDLKKGKPVPYSERARVLCEKGYLKKVTKKTKKQSKK